MNYTLSDKTNVHVAASPHGECTLCKKSANLVCQRCGDFYCSIQCQRSDWKVHRAICIPMPVLVEASDFFVVKENIPQLGVLNGNAQPKQNQQKALSNGVQIPLVDHPPESKPNLLSQKQQQDKKRQPLQQNNRLVSQPEQSSKQDNQKPLIVLPKNNSQVCVYGFHSTNRVYVRSLNPDDDSAFQMILRKVDEYGKSAIPLLELPRPHQAVITNYNGAMHRGTVHYIRNVMKIRILLTDVGVIVDRQLAELLMINKEISNLPRYVTMFHLKTVPVHQLNKPLEEFMVKLCGRYTIKYFKDISEGAKIQLLCETGKSLNELVCDYLHNKAKSKNPFMKLLSLPPVLEKPYESNLLVENATNVKVVVLDTSSLSLGYIACIKKEDEPDFKRFNIHVRSLMLGRQPAYTPVLHEYCMAQFDGEWFRAKVIDVNDQIFTVNYVDFTNTGEVTSEQIRRYPDDLKNPCRTSLCALNNGPDELEKKHIEVLEKHFSDNTEIVIDRVVQYDREDDPPCFLIDYFKASDLLKE